MKTSHLLPEECKQEIRAEAENLKAIYDQLVMFVDDATGENIDPTEAWRSALMWVLEVEKPTLIEFQHLGHTHYRCSRCGMTFCGDGVERFYHDCEEEK